MSDIVEKLKEACVGHPTASIPWPHRLLHNAADEITTLRRELAEAQSRIRALIDDGQKRTDDEVRYQDMLAEKDQELAEARAEVERLTEETAEQRRLKEGYYNEAADGWAKFKKADALLQAGRHAFNDLNPNGKTIIDFFNVWLDHAHDSRRKAESRARALEDALAGVLQDLRDRSTTGFDGERVLQISQSVLTEAEKVLGPNLTLAQRRRDVVEAAEEETDAEDAFDTLDYHESTKLFDWLVNKRQLRRAAVAALREAKEDTQS